MVNRIFKFLEYDYKEQLPKLVLGVRIYEGDINPYYKFKKQFNFINIQHQTGGIICNQIYIQGKILKPKSAVQKAMFELVSKWYSSNAIEGLVRLDEVLEYRKDIKRLFGEEVDCNYSHQQFEEGIYPLDVSPEIILKLTEDELPKDLDDMIIWEDKHGYKRPRYAGVIGRWSLWMLGKNSD